MLPSNGNKMMGQGADKQSPLLSLKASLTVTKVSAAPFVSAVIVCAAGNAELSPCEGRSQRVDRD